MEIGPGPQKDFKKGQWTRINRPYHDTREEASYGIDSFKGRENQVREELKTEKGKKQKLEEGKTKQSTLFVTQRGLAEVVEQPRREQ